MNRNVIAVALGALSLAVAAPAAAQSARSQYGWPGYGDARAPYYEARRAAYDNGYREGIKHGERDGRRGENFAYSHDRNFQRADKGYSRHYGSIDQYRQSFRAGYAEGYREAYSRYSRRGSWGHDGPRRDDRGGYGYGYGYGSSAPYQYGLNDGYEKGVEDARERRSFDILRHKWYRSGDRHYDRRFGSKEQYAAIYREGFKEGYERGYREGRWR